MSDGRRTNDIARFQHPVLSRKPVFNKPEMKDLQLNLQVVAGQALWVNGRRTLLSVARIHVTYLRRPGDFPVTPARRAATRAARRLARAHPRAGDRISVAEGI